MQTTFDGLGQIEAHTSQWVKGWALNQQDPSLPVEIQVFDEERTLVDTFTPSAFRWDLKQQGYGTGHHGFIYQVPAQIQTEEGKLLHFTFRMTGRPLTNSPVYITPMPEGKRIPFHTESLVGRKVLCFAPHPDDETYSIGGSLALHRRHADAVRVVFLTDGSKGGSSQGYTREELIALRQQEARNACFILGVTDYEFWSIPDRSLTVNEETVQRFVALLESFRPSLIYVPSHLEFHPDHRAAAHLVWKAIQRTGLSTMVAFSDANRPINVNTLVDITSVVEQKQQACHVYESQEANYPYTDAALGYNRYRALTVASESTHVEAFYVVDSDDIIESPIEIINLRQFMPDTVVSEDSPQVSIIVRTKNRPSLLREALSSILTQTYSHIEVIVVNDGGDEVAAICEEFSPYYPLTSIRHETSLGRPRAANAGIQQSTGKYITFLDDDDVLYANHINKLVTYLETTGHEFAYSDCEMGHYAWFENEFHLEKPKQLYMGIDYDRDRLHLGNFIPMICAMFTRELYDGVGPFDAELDVYEDWDLWLRMAEHTDLHRAPGVTAEYRVFAPAERDEEKWTQKIYQKYKSYWTLDNIVQNTGPRIDMMQIEIRRLRAYTQHLTQTLEKQNEYVKRLETDNASLKGTLGQIQTSWGWRSILRLNAVRTRLIPTDSTLERIYLRLRKLITPSSTE